MRTLMFAIVLALCGLSGRAATAQCPSVGADTGCGIIINITNSGATFISTGQPPYDDIEDTLVGVINNSNLPVTSIDLTSGMPIFGFDGDGIDTYGVPGNSKDGTGYGGPNAYFTNINGSTSGRVNFITPIATGGGTSFFSLEGALTSATACSTLLNNSVPKPPGSGTSITATFTPNNAYTLAQAAQLCNFIEFDWQSTITSWPAPSTLFSACSTVPLVAPPPFNDPPACGYAYQRPPNAVQLPVYWNLFTTGPLSLTGNMTATQLFFGDQPADPCLPGTQSAATAAYADSVCGGRAVRAPAGSKLGFTTHLVGIAGALPGASVVDTGIGFTWTSTFNGTSGGIAVANGIEPVDPGSGTGGIEVTSYNGITTLSGVSVTGVNGGSFGAIATLASGDSCNGVYSGTFDGNIIVVAGQSCTFINGKIAGNVVVEGGSLLLSGDLISGDVNITGPGSFSIAGFTTIQQNMTVNNLTGGATPSQMCGATVLGNLQFNNNNVPLEIGVASPSSCPGNVIAGNMVVDTNTGSVSVAGNTITGNLSCSGNVSIIGGGDTALHKLGQCVGF